MTTDLQGAQDAQDAQAQMVSTLSILKGAGNADTSGGRPLLAGRPRRVVRVYFRWPSSAEGGYERIPTHVWVVPYRDVDGLLKIRREEHPEWDDLPDSWEWVEPESAGRVIRDRGVGDGRGRPSLPVTAYHPAAIGG